MIYPANPEKITSYENRPDAVLVTRRGSTPNREAQRMESLAERAARYREEWEHSTDIPYGFCWCGCGRPTPIRKEGDRYGLVHGEPVRYFQGHARRKSRVAYVAQDCGYSTPCWVWQRGTKGGGYGRVWVPALKEQVYAHRHYWEQRNGPIPEGMSLDHLCRNRPCVNPDHLEVVTHAENVQRGRLARLNRARVAEIREAFADGAGLTDVVQRFAISRTHAHRIRSGQSWRDE